MNMAVMFLSHVMDIDRSNDGIQLGDPGPMMGIDTRNRVSLSPTLLGLF